MDKKIEEVLYKKLKRFHEQLQTDNKRIYELYDLLDEAKVLARCRNCEIEKSYQNRLFEERYTECKTEKECRLVTDIVRQIRLAEERGNSTREKYGKKAFEILKAFTPKLLSCDDQSEKDWNDVFGQNYSSLTDEKKVSLIALTELVGGNYRLKDITAVFEK